MNAGSSPYHAIGALFCRAQDGTLLSAEGTSSAHISNHWSELRKLIDSGERTSVTLPSRSLVTSTTIVSAQTEHLKLCSRQDSHSHVVSELFKGKENHFLGIIRCDTDDVSEPHRGFVHWLETFILLETSLCPATNSATECPKGLQVTETITTLFANTLRNVASNDEWDTGISLFRKRVFGFVARGERIQMGLPAFPCKSPNPRKVGGSGPDMAERLALGTLHDFTRMVNNIYPPGVTIWIISDGHVFSDCIGVADEAVSCYDRGVLDMYRRTFTSVEDHSALKFRGLTDMFFSHHDLQTTFDPEFHELFDIEHPVHSELSPDAELARGIMMAGFQNSRAQFRELIADQHPPTLSLYRGQARFMQDDLPDTVLSALSNKQRKKLSFAVAAEMIARNQAYSNLLELLLPNFVRLSIHAHSNKGPKFGIRLFPRTQVQAIDSIANRHALCPSYEFQVPTPWHNAIIKIAGDDKIYLGKAEIVQEAIDQGDYQGSWADDLVEGGHFCLQSTITACNTPFTSTDSASTVYADYIEIKDAVVTTSEPIDLMSLTAAHDRHKMRISVRLRGRAYRVLELSRLFAKRVVENRLGMGTGKRGMTVSTC